MKRRGAAAPDALASGAESPCAREERRGAGRQYGFRSDRSMQDDLLISAKTPRVGARPAAAPTRPKMRLARRTASLCVALGVALAVGCRSVPALRPGSHPSREIDFEATAYSITGTTASGQQTRPWTLAADPAIIPLGARIAVRGAGAYSGEYIVTDTGPGVKGHRIDIFLQDPAEAKRFGRRHVRVERLESQPAD